MNIVFNSQRFWINLIFVIIIASMWEAFHLNNFFALVACFVFGFSFPIFTPKPKTMQEQLEEYMPEYMIKEEWDKRNKEK